MKLTNETARLPVPRSALERQYLRGLEDQQAGRSLDAFLRSRLGKKSMERDK